VPVSYVFFGVGGVEREREREGRSFSQAGHLISWVVLLVDVWGCLRMSRFDLGWGTGFVVIILFTRQSRFFCLLAAFELLTLLTLSLIYSLYPGIIG
jgi:hypothetical protein